MAPAPATFRARVDFPGAPPLAFARPVRVLSARALAEVAPLLEEVDREARAGRWAVGWIGYEAAPAFDRALRTRDPGGAPLARFGIFDAPGEAPVNEPPGGIAPLVPEIGPGEHARAVHAIRESIAAGDVYQVNLTFRLRGRLSGDPLGLYRRLLRGQGSCHGACVVDGERAVLSASPELFFSRRGGTVKAHPMKGTRPRGRFEEEDELLARELRESQKEQAENVMIVDLLRNDLGRVAIPGGVRVAELFRVERYRTVLQLVSTVEAELAPGVGLPGLIGALFPCGSVTGAPKAAAMAAIARLERSARGAYCGAIGLVRPGGDADFSVAIRTVEVTLATGEVACGVGGGITWGSEAGAEWDEALAKGAFVDEGSADGAGEPGLIETLRLEDGRFPLLERHLARLAASARHLGLALDPEGARRALLDHAAGAAGASRSGHGAWRVRLLARAGGFELEAAPLPAPATAPLPVRIARTPVSRRDRRLFHKTTRREPYESARADAPEAFDVLLWNEEGEATEFTIGNLVAEIDGEARTPPRACGLLAGVMRAELLDRGEIVERQVRVDELPRATRLWLVNAVRGRVPVRLVG